MNKHEKFLFLLAMILSCVSCTKEEQSGPENESGSQVVLPEYVYFKADKNGYQDVTSAQSETSSFSENDIISVYSWINAYKESNIIANGVKYKCVDNISFVPSTETDSIKWRGKTDSHFFIATYPEKEIDDIRSFEITDNDSELLVAAILGENGGAVPENDTVSLSFKHILSRVNVTIDYADVSIQEYGDMYFENVSNTGKLDLVTLKLTHSSVGKKIFAKNEDNTYTVDIVPQTISGLKFDAKAQGSDFKLVYTYSDELNFEAGKIFNLVFKLIPNGEMELSDMTVDNWGDGDVVAGEMEELQLTEASN